MVEVTQRYFYSPKSFPITRGDIVEQAPSFGLGKNGRARLGFLRPHRREAGATNFYFSRVEWVLPTVILRTKSFGGAK